MPDVAPNPSTERLTPTPRRRRLRLRALAAAGLGALVLAACTPSNYQAERRAVASIHYLETGQSVSAEDVRCNNFENTRSGTYEGLCTAGNTTWAVTSEYNDDKTRAHIDVWLWDLSMSGVCDMEKDSGTWVIASCG